MWTWQRKANLKRNIQSLLIATQNNAIRTNHTKVRMKESEKKDEYLDLARELKKLRNMKGTFIPIVIGALGTVTKGLVQGKEDSEIMGQVETIQITALLTSVRILRIIKETCCHSNSSERPPANADVKNS